MPSSTASRCRRPQRRHRPKPSGRVDTIQGTVEATRANGTKVALSQGDSVFQGDVIQTAADGAVSLVMADDTVFSLDADGEVRLDEMVYDPVSQTGNISANLVKGVFSFVSGQIATTDPDAMILTTAVATVGIRGTTGAMNLPLGEPLVLFWPQTPTARPVN